MLALKVALGTIRATTYAAISVRFTRRTRDRPLLCRHSADVVQPEAGQEGDAVRSFRLYQPLTRRIQPACPLRKFRCVRQLRRASA